MGIEAISRGAADATFVEKDRHVLAALKATLKSLNLESCTHLLAMDALQAIPVLQTQPFSFVYIDPPYALVEPLPDLLCLIDEQLPLAPGAVVFLETRKGAFTPPSLSRLGLASFRTSGDSDLYHYHVLG